MMADYTEKEIKYIKEGELILGFDEYQNNKGQDRNVFPSKVLQLHERESEVLEITLENGYKINITENHKVLTINVWCEAKFLNIYDEVMVLDKGNQKLIPSKVKEIKEVGFVKVYNIGTESRTYIANNIAVHNCFEKHKNNYMTKEVMRKALVF
jgi:intein/homing endonuclease